MKVVHESISLLGPVLVGIAAIIASGLTAGLTVYFANRRLASQLSADRDLQRDQLAADRDLQKDQLEHARRLHLEQLEASQTRIALQLEHDRDMRFRDGVREFLDSVLERERRLRQAANAFVVKVGRLESKWEQVEASSISDSEKKAQFSNLRSELIDEHLAITLGIAEGYGDNILLRVRLDKKEVTDSFDEVIDAINERVETMPSPNEWHLRSDEEKAETEATEEKVAEKQNAFLTACRKWHTGRI